MKYYLDANIFIYSANLQDPRHESCKIILAAIAKGKVEAFTSVETFEEIVHYGKKNEVLQQTLTLCKKLLRTQLQILPFAQDILIDYFKMIKKYGEVKIDSRDVLHVVIALRNGIKIIISADRDFDKIKEIKRIDPVYFVKQIKD